MTYQFDQLPISSLSLSSSAFCCLWRTCRSSLQTYNSWQKGILFRWTVSMEQSPDVP